MAGVRKCPRCRTSFGDDRRFCPFDGELLATAGRGDPSSPSRGTGDWISGAPDRPDERPERLPDLLADWDSAVDTRGPASREDDLLGPGRLLTDGWDSGGGRSAARDDGPRRREPWLSQQRWEGLVLCGVVLGVLVSAFTIYRANRFRVHVVFNEARGFYLRSGDRVFIDEIEAGYVDEVTTRTVELREAGAGATGGAPQQRRVVVASVTLQPQATQDLRRSTVFYVTYHRPFVDRCLVAYTRSVDGPPLSSGAYVRGYGRWWDKLREIYIPSAMDSLQEIVDQLDDL